MKTLKRLIEVRFDGTKLYMDDNLYATLFEINKEGNNLTLVFNDKKKYPMDPRVSEWIDVDEFEYFNGIYYDPDKVQVSGQAQHWISPIRHMFFIIRESKQ
jgi:hypothetical protein